MIVMIEISRIEVRDRERLVDPAWAALMAETARDGAVLPPIDVFEEEPGQYRLVTGAHRLAALSSLGRTEIEARVWTREAFRSEAEIKLREIQENAIRAEFNELDRAVAMATWQGIYEDLHPSRKRPGRPKMGGGEIPADAATIFAESFGAVAARLLRLSERSIRVYLQIAKGIGPSIRALMVGKPITRQQSELILLSGEAPELQAKILGMLHSEPPVAGSVSEAIAILKRQPPEAKPAAWEAISDRFARLKVGDRHAFYRVHLAEIRAFLAAEEG